MKVGDKVTFSFGQGEKEGVVEKLFAKTVYLRVNFPKHPNKLIVRKLSDFEADASSAQKKKKKEEALKKRKEMKKGKEASRKDKKE